MLTDCMCRLDPPKGRDNLRHFCQPTAPLGRCFEGCRVQHLPEVQGTTALRRPALRRGLPDHAMGDQEVIALFDVLGMGSR